MGGVGVEIRYDNDFEKHCYELANALVDKFWPS